MITIFVKTLDAQSKRFEVPNSTTVKNLKEEVASSLNVPVNQQRFIYRGAVLKDNFVFTQEHNEIVLHLVERPPATTDSPSSSTNTASQSESTTSTANTAGSNFNPGHLSQLVFQQAMAGLGSLFGFGAQNRNGVSSGGGAPTAQPANPSTSRASSSTNQSTTPATSNQQSDCLTRQQCRGVERLLVNLNDNLTQLEDNRKRTEARSSKDAKCSSAQTSQTDTPSTSTDSNRSSSGSRPIQPSFVPNCPNHPSMSEVGSLFSRMLKAQKRLAPFTDQVMQFFNTDPSFSSTESEEFRSTEELLNLTLQSQHMLSEVQRILSNVSIPLSQTPPRTLNMNTRQGRPGVAQGQPRRNVSPSSQARGPQSNAPNQLPSYQGSQPNMSLPGEGNLPNQTHYSIVVNAHVQPRVDILVSQSPPGNLPGSQNSSSTSQPANSRYQGATNVQATPVGQPNIPLIPGIPQDVLANIFQSLSGSMQQSGSQQPVQASGIVVQGPPGGPNQIVEDVSSIVAESVTNAMRSQLSGVSQSNQIPGTTTVSSTASAATTPSSPNASTLASGGSFGVRVIPSASPRQTPPTANPRQARPPTSNPLQAPPRFTPPQMSFSAPGFMQQMMRNIGPGFAGFFNVPLTRFLANMGVDLQADQESGILTQVFEVIGNELTFGELLAIGSPGGAAPLNRIRIPVQTFLIRNCFGGRRPDSKEIEEHATSVMQDRFQYITELFAGVKVKPNVDVVRSNIKILTDMLKQTLEIFFFADSANFAEELTHHFRYAFSLLVNCNSVMVEGEQELAQVARAFTTRALSGDPGARVTIEMMYGSMEPRGQPYVALVRSLVALQTIDRNRINNYLVMKDSSKWVRLQRN